MNLVDDGLIGFSVVKTHEALTHPIFVAPAHFIVEHAVAFASAKVEADIGAPVRSESYSWSMCPVMACGVCMIDDGVFHRRRHMARDEILNRRGRDLEQAAYQAVLFGPHRSEHTWFARRKT